MALQNETTRKLVNENTEYVRSMGNSNKLFEDMKNKVYGMEQMVENFELNS